MFASTEENGFQEAWRKSNRSESRLLVDLPPSPCPNIIYDQNLKLHQKKKDSPRPLPPRSGRARPDVFARPIVYNRRSWITAAIGGISSDRTILRILRYSAGRKPDFRATKSHRILLRVQSGITRNENSCLRWNRARCLERARLAVSAIRHDPESYAV